MPGERPARQAFRNCFPSLPPCLLPMWCWMPLMRLLVPVLGTPEAILRLHRLHLLETALALPLMLMHWVIFSISAMKLLTMHGLIVSAAILSVPLLLTCLRLPSLVRLDRHCRGLVMRFRGQLGEAEGIAERTLQLLWCRAAQDQRLFSLLLICWYSLGLAWQTRKAPCSLTDDVNRDLLEVECQVFHVSCIFFIMVNGSLCIAAMVAPFVVARCPDNFTPLHRRGIPKEVLDALPVFEFGEAFPTTRTECVICFGGFEAGERLRRLPCGHEFHALCIDGWLHSSPTCPMRCSWDIWTAINGNGWSTVTAPQLAAASQDQAADDLERGVVPAAPAVASLLAASVPEPVLLGAPSLPGTALSYEGGADGIAFIGSSAASSAPAASAAPGRVGAASDDAAANAGGECPEAVPIGGNVDVRAAATPAVVTL